MAQCILTHNKKAQAWSLDLVVAIIIFLAAMGILFYYTLNYPLQSGEELNELFYEGNLASELILSEDGVGILSEKSINQTKLENFNALGDDEKKGSLGIKNNFYFTMENLEIGGSPTGYVGIMNTSDIENLIQVTRITIYKNKPTKFELFTWS